MTGPVDRRSALDPELQAQLERLVEDAVDARLARAADAAVAAAAGSAARREQDGVALLVFSGEMDRLLAALNVAIAGAALGTPTTMFFAFWGLSAMRRRAVHRGKPFAQRLMSWMLPSRLGRSGLSRMQMGGVGPRFFQHVMRQKNVEGVPGLVRTAQELGVRMVACQMSMDVMGIRTEELVEGMEVGGATGFVGRALDARVSMFV